MQKIFFIKKNVCLAGCTAEEYDCEDATCISIDLKCNQRINCRFRWDEDECQVSIQYILLISLESESNYSEKIFPF